MFLKILWYFVGRGMKYNDLAISTKFVEVIDHPMEVEMLTFRTLALRQSIFGLRVVYIQYQSSKL